MPKRIIPPNAIQACCRPMPQIKAAWVLGQGSRLAASPAGKSALRPAPEAARDPNQRAGNRDPRRFSKSRLRDPKPSRPRPKAAYRSARKTPTVIRKAGEEKPETACPKTPTAPPGTADPRIRPGG